MWIIQYKSNRNKRISTQTHIHVVEVRNYWSRWRRWMYNTCEQMSLTMNSCWLSRNFDSNLHFVCKPEKNWWIAYGSLLLNNLNACHFMCWYLFESYHDWPLLTNISLSWKMQIIQSAPISRVFFFVSCWE